MIQMRWSQYIHTYVFLASVYPLHALLNVADKTAYDVCDDLAQFYGVAMRGTDSPSFLLVDNYVARDWRPTTKECHLSDADYYAVPNAARSKIRGKEDVLAFMENALPSCGSKNGQAQRKSTPGWQILQGSSVEERLCYPSCD
jgi:hypothetical protein